jgi:creatinine amidohydrolase/Fe(II)-dependent formamide hydrolase-like protein
MLVILWEDVHHAGPAIQLLVAVSDMGEARRIAEAADVEPATKTNRIERKHPLYEVAASRPGELLWRSDEDPNHRDGFAGKPWKAGAESARAFRQADVDRYIDIVEAARERRKHRR